MRRAALLALAACATPPAEPVRVPVAPAASASSMVLQADTGPPLRQAAANAVVMDEAALGSDGPYATLGDYCAAITKECVPGSASLCDCTVEDQLKGDLPAATLTIRNSDRFETDHNFRVAALEGADGWWVSKKGVEGFPGGETHLGFYRRLVRLVGLTVRDVAGGDAVERVFSFVQVGEDTPPGASQATVTIEGSALIVCGTPPDAWCTAPIEIDWRERAAAPPAAEPRKDTLGRMVIDGEEDQNGQPIAHAIRGAR